MLGTYAPDCLLDVFPGSSIGTLKYIFKIRHPPLRPVSTPLLAITVNGIIIREAAQSTWES